MRARAWQWALYGGLSLVLVAALIPAFQLPNTGWYKAHHVAVFAVLAAMAQRAYPGSPARAMLGLLAYGIVIELLQALTPYRTAEAADALANGLGIAAAAAIATLPRTSAFLGTRLLALSRVSKRGLALLADASLCVLSVWLAFGVRIDSWADFGAPQRWATWAALGLALPLLYASGLYKAVVRFDSGLQLVRASIYFGVLYALLFTVVGVPQIPRSVGLMVPALFFLGAAGTRLLMRSWLGSISTQGGEKGALPQVLVYGAGEAGQQAASALNGSRKMNVRGFVDDSPSLVASTVRGLPVYASSRLAEVVRQYDITDVLLAMPSSSRARRAEIISAIHALQLPLHVRTLPDLSDIAQGRVQVDHVRELDVQDLLGRDAVEPDAQLLQAKITGKVVLVTGAGGSIGSELCRQIKRLCPTRLILLEVSEFALYAIHHELECNVKSLGLNIDLVPILGSVRDAEHVRKILNAWQPDTIYHAAAYKHVPLVEHNPAEGVKNNTFGTLTMARLASECGVKDFVLISTDKAVRPTNVMGASKRLAEMVLQALARQGGSTCFSMVRFGNVLGSSGSVVPLFRRQIRDGGPVTLTHPDITRYFMTIPEAAQLVIQASAMAKGGDVFLLDMGEPVKIIDLACRMVELSGLTVRDEANPDGDIAIEITGLRPGEKLYEELLIGNNPLPTQHPLVMKGHEECPPWEELSAQLKQLLDCLERDDVAGIRQVLKQAVPGYRPEPSEPPAVCQSGAEDDIPSQLPDPGPDSAF